MVRPLRIEYEGALYHVTARGNERRSIFFKPTDNEKFLQYVSEAKQKYGILIHCYVLMTNHYHLIIQTPEANLSRVMHYKMAHTPHILTLNGKEADIYFKEDTKRYWWQRMTIY